MNSKKETTHLNIGSEIVEINFKRIENNLFELKVVSSECGVIVEYFIPKLSISDGSDLSLVEITNSNVKEKISKSLAFYFSCAAEAIPYDDPEVGQWLMNTAVKNENF